MNDHELDPQTDPVMARINRAMPTSRHQVPSANEPAAQALMKEIMMTNNNTTLDRTNEATPNSGSQPPFHGGDGNVIPWQPRRRRLLTVAAAAAIAVGAVGVSIAIQEGTSATDRVHAAAIETRDLGSGIVRIDVSINDTGGPGEQPLDITETGTIRFDGADRSYESDPDGETGIASRSITVDGRTYSTLLGDQWQDITDAAAVSGPTPVSFQLDAVLDDLGQLEGFANDGTEIVDGVTTTRYLATAQVGDLDDSVVAAFGLVPTVDGDLPLGPVDYTVWIDGDGVIARLRAEASDATRSVSTDATFSELGVPQRIVAPEDFIVFDPSATTLFDVLAATPEEVLDQCIPDIQNMSDLAPDAFNGIIECFRTAGADPAADLFTDLGPAGLDEAVNIFDQD